MRFRILLVPALAALLAACQPTAPDPSEPPAESAPMEIGYPEIDGETAPPPAGFDVRAFEAFIAEKPLPDAFQTRYPNIQLVLPNMMSTREYRTDYTRFFARLDDEGRIVSGYFS